MSEDSYLPLDPPSDPPMQEQPPDPGPDQECDVGAPQDPFHSVLTTGLLHLFGEGDDDALGHFLAVEGKHLRRYIDRRLPGHVRGPIGIDDILQEVVISLADKRDQGELEVINTPAFRGLVRKITQGVISRVVAAAHAQKRDIARKAPQAGTDGNSSAQGDLIDQVPARTDSPSKMVHRGEQIDALELSLAAMTQDEVEIIDMRHRRNLEYIEIGELLKISEGNARKRFHRAITHLRELLRKHYPESI
ncbi:MAG: sigma-70 family RNA polymerase sigma factor [Planctomycetota bacterium]|nr:sigma-70 family RNA polymerase sigma factor [Planctomycetota bacterium]